MMVGHKRSHKDHLFPEIGKFPLNSRDLDPLIRWLGSLFFPLKSLQFQRKFNIFKANINSGILNLLNVPFNRAIIDISAFISISNTNEIVLSLVQFCFCYLSFLYVPAISRCRRLSKNGYLTKNCKLKI